MYIHTHTKIGLATACLICLRIWCTSFFFLPPLIFSVLVRSGGLHQTSTRRLTSIFPAIHHPPLPTARYLTLAHLHLNSAHDCLSQISPNSRRPLCQTRHKELINDTAHPPLSFGRPSSATYNRPPTSPHVRQLILVSPETSLPHWTTPLSLLLRYRPVIVPAEVTATRNHVSPFLQRHRRSVLTILNSQFLLFGSMSVC